MAIFTGLGGPDQSVRQRRWRRGVQEASLTLEHIIKLAFVPAGATGVALVVANVATLAARVFNHEELANRIGRIVLSVAWPLRMGDSAEHRGRRIG